MMKCRDFIFLLTSGQLQKAPVGLRAEAYVHQLICHRCRTFQNNEKKLDQLLDECRQELETPQPDPDNDQMPQE